MSQSPSTCEYRVVKSTWALPWPVSRMAAFSLTGCAVLSRFLASKKSAFAEFWQNKDVLPAPTLLHTYVQHRLAELIFFIGVF